METSKCCALPDGLTSGCRVVVLADEDNPEERGVLDSAEVVNGAVVVTLDREYRGSPFDDGLREVGVSQVRAEGPSRRELPEPGRWVVLHVDRHDGLVAFEAEDLESALARAFRNHARRFDPELDGVEGTEDGGFSWLGGGVYVYPPSRRDAAARRALELALG